MTKIIIVFWGAN